MQPDDAYSPRPLAGWFKAAAIAATLFMLLGAVSYLFSVMADPATMSLDQRAVYEAEPWWMTGAYGLAVWPGLTGAVLLLLRKKLAVPILLLSMVATIVWFGGFLLVRDLQLNMSSDELAAPAIILVLTWTIYWFARHSRQRGWLS